MMIPFFRHLSRYFRRQLKRQLTEAAHAEQLRQLCQYDPSEITDEEVEHAIRSVPTHRTGITYVSASTAHATFGSSTLARTLAWAAANGSGNLLVVLVVLQGGGPPTVTVSDSVNGSYTQAGAYSTIGGTSVSVWYFANCAAGTPTVTVTPSAAAAISITLREFSGVATSSPVRGTITNNGGGSTTETTGTCTANAADMVIAVAGSGIGFTSGSVALPFGTFLYFAGGADTMVAHDTNAVGSEGATFTTSNSPSSWAAMAVSFKNNTPTYSVSPANTTVGPSQTDVFTFTPGGNLSGTITPSPTAGSFSPATVVFDGTGAAKTSTYTAPASNQTVTVNYTNNASFLNPGNTTLTIQSTYTASPASTLLFLSGTTVFTFTPNFHSTDTVTPSSTAGSFSPATIVFDGTGAAKTATYTAPAIVQTVTVSYTNSGSMTNPASTTLTIISNTLLQDYVASVKAKVQANTTQWQSFKNRLDSGDANFGGLNSVLDGTYEGTGNLPLASDYALGAIVLSSIDAVTAKKYADKATAILNSLCNDYQSSGGLWSVSWQPFAITDGSSTVYTLPQTPNPSGSFVLRMTTAYNVAVTHVTNAIDSATAAPNDIAILKVSNSSGAQATANYTKGTDWQQIGNVPADGVQHSFTYYVDWSLASATQPATTTLSGNIDNVVTSVPVASTTGFAASGTIGIDNEQITYTSVDATHFLGCTRGANGTTAASHTSAANVSRVYYITGGSPSDLLGGTVSPQPTLSGNQITFSVAPAAGNILWAKFLYVDGSGRNYQQSSNGTGGYVNAGIDSGFTLRFLSKHGALCYNWLTAGGFSLPAALDSRFRYLANRWFNFTTSPGDANGLARFARFTESNYSIGYYVGNVLAALALRIAGDSNGTSMVSTITTFRNNNVRRSLAGTAQPAGTVCDSGYWTEGYDYGDLSTISHIIAALGGEQGGLWTATEERTAFAAALTSLNHSRYQRLDYFVDSSHGSAENWHRFGYIAPLGDNLDYPYAWPSPEFTYALSAFLSGSPQAWAQWENANTPAASTHDMNDVLFHDPTTTGSDPALALPLDYYEVPTGYVVSRSDWNLSATSVWVGYICGDILEADHQNEAAGSMMINRGPDDLILNAMNAAAWENYPVRSRYCSLPVMTTAAQTTQEVQGSNYGYYFNYTATTDSGTHPPTPNVTTYDSNVSAGYAYTKSNVNPAYSAAGSPGAGNCASECTRDWFYLRSQGYVVVYDRFTLLSASNTEIVRWWVRSNPTASISGNSWNATQGNSKVFVKAYSSATLATTTATAETLSSGHLGGTFYRVDTTRSVYNTSPVRYVSGLQITASTTGAMDASAHITGVNSKLEGLIIGHAVVMFGINGKLATADTETYSFTDTLSATTTHYVGDLLPNTPYTITGGNQANVTTTAAGVASFTSTGTGASQSVTLAPVAATTYTATPATTTPKVGATDVITITPNGTSTATVTLHLTGAGSLSSTTVTFDGSATPQTVTYTAPGTPGTATISYTNNGALANPGNTVLNIGVVTAPKTDGKSF